MERGEEMREREREREGGDQVDERRSLSDGSLLFICHLILHQLMDAMNVQRKRPPRAMAARRTDGVI